MNNSTIHFARIPPFQFPFNGKISRNVKAKKCDKRTTYKFSMRREECSLTLKYCKVITRPQFDPIGYFLPAVAWLDFTMDKRGSCFVTFAFGAPHCCSCCRIRELEKCDVKSNNVTDIVCYPDRIKQQSLCS